MQQQQRSNSSSRSRSSDRNPPFRSRQAGMPAEAASRQSQEASREPDRTETDRERQIASATPALVTRQRDPRGDPDWTWGVAANLPGPLPCAHLKQKPRALLDAAFRNTTPCRMGTQSARGPRHCFVELRAALCSAGRLLFALLLPAVPPRGARQEGRGKKRERQRRWLRRDPCRAAVDARVLLVAADRCVLCPSRLAAPTVSLRRVRPSADSVQPTKKTRVPPIHPILPWPSSPNFRGGPLSR
jgi:hypothetical protein